MSDQQMPTLVPIVCPRCNGLKLDPHLGAGSTDANGANGPLPCEFSLGGCNGAGFLLLPLSPESREARELAVGRAYMEVRNAHNVSWEEGVKASGKLYDAEAALRALDEVPQ